MFDEGCFYLSGNMTDISVPKELAPLFTHFCRKILAQASPDFDDLDKQPASGALKRLQYAMDNLTSDIRDCVSHAKDLEQSPDYVENSMLASDGVFLESSSSVMLGLAELLLLGDAEEGVKPFGALDARHIKDEIAWRLLEEFDYCLDACDLGRDPDLYSKLVVVPKYTETDTGVTVSLSLHYFKQSLTAEFTVPLGSYIWDLYPIYAAAVGKAVEDIERAVNSSGTAFVMHG